MSRSYLKDAVSPNVARWLLFMIFLVVAMVLLGGATRLTNSGLSITEWKPITGALPPLSHEHWLEEFRKYQQIPEFSAEHPDMTLKEFEFIYFMEWSHRQLGRFIGLAYALPLFWFAFRRKLPAGKSLHFFAVLLLIGVQGAIGWWMVASGLTGDRVDVAPYRLATHFAVAFLILAILFWLWRDVREGWQMRSEPPIFVKSSVIIFALVYLQIIFGAFVAGTHAGKTYNTWPLMDGRIFPDGYAMLSPFWRNLSENITAIQFNHRTLAYIIFAAVSLQLFRSLRKRILGPTVVFLWGLIIAQIGIGIWTLLWVVPINLALLHQFFAILVFLAALSFMRSATRGH